MLETILGLVGIISGLLFVINFRFYLFDLFFRGKSESLEGAVMLSKVDRPEFFRDNTTDFKSVLALFLLFSSSFLIHSFNLITVFTVLFAVSVPFIILFIDFLHIKWIMREYSEEELSENYKRMMRVRNK